MASRRATSRWMSLVTSAKSSVDTALSMPCAAGSISRLSLKLPWSSYPADAPTSNNLIVFISGRLRSEVSVAQAQEEISVMNNAEDLEAVIISRFSVDSRVVSHKEKQFGNGRIVLRYFAHLRNCLLCWKKIYFSFYSTHVTINHYKHFYKI